MHDPGDPMILKINQDIHVPEVDHCLLQDQWYGNQQDTKVFNFWSCYLKPILIAHPMDDDHIFTIPLQHTGIVSYVECALPTSAEYEDEDKHHLELMVTTMAWNPYDDEFTLQQEIHLNFRGNLISAARSNGHCWMADIGTRSTNSECQDEPISLQYDAAGMTENDNLDVTLEAVQMSLVKTC